MRLLLATLLLSVCAATVGAQENPAAAAGRDTFLSADYATPRQYPEPLAEAGDAEAQVEFGLMQAGAGNDAAAIFWFFLPGQRGYPGAPYNADALAQRLQTYEIYDVVRRTDEGSQTGR